MNKIFLIVFVIVALLTTCKDSSNVKLNITESIFQLSDFPLNEKLIFNDLNNIEGYAVDIIQFGNSLIIDEMGKSDAISIYSKGNGDLLNTELSIGRGPNEIIATFGHGIINDSIFWTYEGETTKIRFYLVDEILKRTKAKVLKTISFKLNRFAYKIVPINMKSFIISGCPEYSSKTTILNDAGGVIDSMGKYSNLTFNDLTFLKGAYLYNITLRTDNKRIALAYYRTDVIEIYDIKGRLIKAIHGPDNYNIEPKPTRKNMSDYFRRSKKTKEAYIGVKSTQKYIYSIYDGTTANKPGPIGSWLFIFDWNGNTVKSFELSEKILAFDVDEKNKIIYAVSLSTGKLIYADFNL